jgi:hypothetical protein
LIADLSVNMSHAIMSHAIHSDLEQFQLYLATQVQSGNAALSPEECLARYRAEHPTAAEFQQRVDEIRQAIDEMDRGDRGRPYQQVLAELRQRYQLSAKQ